MNFEKKVIDLILSLIKDNIEYLCKEENLPQLAKLGYFYATLYYVGRDCYGFNGWIKKGDICGFFD